MGSFLVPRRRRAHGRIAGSGDGHEAAQAHTSGQEGLRHGPLLDTPRCAQGCCCGAKPKAPDAMQVAYLGGAYKGNTMAGTGEDSDGRSNTENTIEFKMAEQMQRIRLIDSFADSAWSRCGRTDKGVSAWANVCTMTVCFFGWELVLLFPLLESRCAACAGLVWFAHDMSRCAPTCAGRARSWCVALLQPLSCVHACAAPSARTRA